MGDKKSAKVITVESVFEVNLAKILAVSKDANYLLLTLRNNSIFGLVFIDQHNLMLMIGGCLLYAQRVLVPCLNGRFRPLLKCPRAHEGNFQSLYLFNGELACRKCLKLRYRSNLASGTKERARIQRMKAMHKLGRQADGTLPEYKKFEWRKKYFKKIAHIKDLENDHYVELKAELK